MKILLAAAGTAGHITPALVTAKELNLFGFEVEFLGADGIEQNLVKSAGYTLHTIKKVPVYRELKALYKNLGMPASLAKQVRVVKKILKKGGHRAVVGFGGYISTPAYLAAKSLKIPVIVHEQNKKVGIANKLGAKYAKTFAYAFSDTKIPKHASNPKHIGLPLRELPPKPRAPKRKLLNVLIFGGSLGAVSLNNALINSLEKVLKIAKVTHITGASKADDALASRAKLPPEMQKNYRVIAYADDILKLMAKSDLVIARSGAGTVHELAALGVPSVLVPLPHGNGEQAHNATLLGKGTLVVSDADFTPSKLVSLLRSFVKAPEKLLQMSEIARQSAKLGAGRELARIVEAEVAKAKAFSYKRAHFMAISGAGIAPVAKCYERFAEVTGCDSIGSGHSPTHLKGQKALVYSSAIRESNPELKRARELHEKGKLEVLHRSDALNELIKMHEQSVTVAGSHGKTSITAMVASILDKYAPEASSYVIGAEANVNGVETNGGKMSIIPRYIVAEADESDGSFQKYRPRIAVISNIEPDHLDHYGDFEGVKKAFANYANRSELLICTPEVSDLLKDSIAVPIRVVNTQKLEKIDLSVPGMYNQVNAQLAFEVTKELCVPEKVSLSALKSFQGAARRFEQHKLGKYLVIDDYAHHPTELEKLIDAAIEEFGSNDFVLLFQPHLFSRTRDFAIDFAKQLGRVKHPIVTKIYKAREEQSDFPEVTPSSISNLKYGVYTTHTLQDGVNMALRLADQSSSFQRRKVILSVGAGPTLVPDFQKAISPEPVSTDAEDAFEHKRKRRR
ncbi:MAG: glycosyltransferase [Candidatus Ancillula sp.]|jgi:undecaprenyldiphospho-muramoylpentapeptide beta-N-acetylglucosaminyltransferase|nr:glycosyltransferase [Candidatus Ancillula sp.]